MVDILLMNATFGPSFLGYELITADYIYDKAEGAEGGEGGEGGEGTTLNKYVVGAGMMC